MIRFLLLFLLACFTTFPALAQDPFHEMQLAWDRERDQNSLITELSRIGREVPTPFPAPSKNQRLNVLLQRGWSSADDEMVVSLEEDFAAPLRVYREAAERSIGSRFPYNHFSDPVPNMLAIQTTTRVLLAASQRVAADGYTEEAMEGVMAATRAGVALQMEGTSLLESLIGVSMRKDAARTAGHILAMSPAESSEIPAEYVATLKMALEKVPHPAEMIRRDVGIAGAMMLHEWEEAMENPPDDPVGRALLKMLEDDPDIDPARDVNLYKEFVGARFGGSPMEFYNMVSTWSEGEKELLEKISPLGEPIYAGGTWLGFRHRQVETEAWEAIAATAALIQSGVPAEEALKEFPDPFTGEALLLEELSGDAEPAFRLRADPPSAAMAGGELATILELELNAEGFIWPPPLRDDGEAP